MKFLFEKGHLVSEKTRQKISKSLKGHKVLEETKSKISEANKGRKLSQEHIKKIVLANIGKKRTEEIRKKISEALKNKKVPEEIREKISNKLKKLKIIPPSRKGQKWPEKQWEKMSGINHYNWQGGKSFELYGFDWTDDLKESIRKRDNYNCQLCGIYQDELNYKLHCHHIDYDKNNLNPDNLIILCRSCHMKTNFNRDYWTNYLEHD